MAAFAYRWWHFNRIREGLAPTPPGATRHILPAHSMSDCGIPDFEYQKKIDRQIIC